jgi:hypothetical protein
LKRIKGVVIFTILPPDGSHLQPFYDIRQFCSTVSIISCCGETWKISQLLLLRKCVTMCWWQVSNEFLNLTQSPDIPPERRQFSFHVCYYNDSQLRQVQTRAIDHWIGPRYVEYCTLQARLNSFKDKWPEGKLPTPEALSTAGFFYDGKCIHRWITLPYTYIFTHPCRMERCDQFSSLWHFLMWLDSNWQPGSNMHATPHTAFTSHMWKYPTLFENVLNGSIARRGGTLMYS